MQSIAPLVSSVNVWFAVAGSALLLCAFLTDRFARELGFEVVDQPGPPDSRPVSLREWAKFALVLAPMLVALSFLKSAHFAWTAGLIVCLSGYIWLKFYLTRIRRLQKSGLSGGKGAALVSLLTLSVGTLAVALVAATWERHGAL